MPRTAKPENASVRERVARWRKHQRAIGRPEASAVDVAVAAAVAEYAGQAAEDPAKDVAVLKEILDGAVDRMVSAGLDRKHAKKKLIRRVGRFSRTVPGERAVKGDGAVTR